MPISDDAPIQVVLQQGFLEAAALDILMQLASSRGVASVEIVLHLRRDLFDLIPAEEVDGRKEWAPARGLFLQARLEEER